MGDMEDISVQLERSVAFLFHQEAKLTAKCEDLELGPKHNDIWIHGIPEGSVKSNTTGCVTELIHP